MEMLQILSGETPIFWAKCLRHGAEHLLGALAVAGSPQVMVMAFEVAHPARAAAGEHRLVFGLPRLEAADELGAFLHDGQVGGEGGVEDIVEAQRPQRRGHPVDGGLLRRQAEALPPGGAHRRGDLHHRDAVGVLDGGERLLGVAALPQGAGGAVGDALAAEHAVGFLDAAIAAHIHPGAAAGAGQIPHFHLDLVTDLDAAHTFDTFVGIPVKREVPRPERPHPGDQVPRVGVVQNAQVVGHGLQVAVAAALAGGAVAVVLAEDEFHIDLAGAAGAGAVGVDDHALHHRVVAAGDQVALPFHLHAADAAGADLVELFQVAQMRNVDAGLAGSLQDGGALGHGDRLVVDGQVYHWVVLPPLKMP